MALESKYDASEMVYPNDLHSNEALYGSNFVVFFVNVTESERPMIDAYGGRMGPSDFVPDFDSRVATAAQEQTISAGSAIAGTAGANAVAGAGLGAIGSLIRGNISGAAKGALTVGAVAALPVAVLKLNGVDFQPAKKRLTKTIMLHMPNEISFTSSMSYGEVDLKNFAMGVEAYNALKSAGTKLYGLEGNATDGSKGYTGELNGRLSGTIDELKRIGSPAMSMSLSAPNMQGVQAATRLAPNPKKEMLFSGVDFRSFQMNYQFFPRNKKESMAVDAIIRQFRFHQHPSFLDDKKFIYQYPSEFDISFYHGDSENPHIPKISTCALIAVNVNYSPNGVWATNGDGSPVQINLSLAFKELSTLTKESIAKGY